MQLEPADWLFRFDGSDCHRSSAFSVPHVFSDSAYSVVLSRL